MIILKQYNGIEIFRFRNQIETIFGTKLILLTGKLTTHLNNNQAVV